MGWPAQRAFAESWLASGTNVHRATMCSVLRERLMRPENSGKLMGDSCRPPPWHEHGSWLAYLCCFQSHLKKCSVSGTDSVLGSLCSISLRFWIHTAQTLELCALYYTKVTSISFEKARLLSVSLYRLLFRESNDRKTNCSVSTGLHALTLRFVSVCSLFLLLSVLYQ